MKKLLAIFALIVVFTSCKQETKADVETEDIATKVSSLEDVITLKGEFIYLDDAAVLNCGNKIYGVTIDEKMLELVAQVALKKNEPFDMIPVIIHGVVTPNPALTEDNQVWQEVVTIKEIVKVFAPTGESAIKVESGN
ncbi:MAG: hypothetical protein ACI828_001135 [Flavobacteriales bacterium]|jgi:hypothetical protein